MSRSLGPKTSALIALVALLLVLLLVWVNIRLAEKKLPGNDRFGLSFISSPDHLAGEARYRGALATGARWDRWPLYWHWVDQGGYVGPHEGGSHDYDTLVAQEIEHGLTPLVILMGTPADQAAARAEATPPDSPDGDSNPLKESSGPVNTAILPPAGLFEPIFRDGTDQPEINPANGWANFVFNSVERYRPQGELSKQLGWPKEAGVRHWEIWNEPDYDLFWAGTVADYYRLLEVAYKSIKLADPEATVVLGGLAFYQDPTWLSQLLDQTQGEPDPLYFDVVSFHHYWSIYSSEYWLEQVQATLAGHGLADLPIWTTESGVSVWDDYPATAHGVPPDQPWRATRAEQANYVIQHAALAFYHGVERYYHFLLHDDCGDGPGSAYGLRQNFSPHVCSPAAGRFRPAYPAYQLAADQFHNLTPLWRNKQYGQDQVAFYRSGDQARLLVLWATQGLTTTATISATGDGATLYWIDPEATLEHGTGLSRTLTLTPTNGLYTLTLPPATNRNGADPNDTSYHIGGRPYLLVEQDRHPPQATITSLPATGPPTFWVTWQGQDPGSGIAGYDVWVSEDGGPLRLWLAETPVTEAEYAGQVGHSYGFAVRATDRAGNEGPQPARPQATIWVVAGPAVAGTVLGPAGEPVAGATVTIAGPGLQETIVTGQDGRWSPVSLPAGEYTFQAIAPGYGSWPAPRQINLEAASAISLTLPPPNNSLASGDFEGNQVWSVWEWEGQVDLSIDAFDGQAAARLGAGTGQPVQCGQNGQTGQQWLLQQRVAAPTEGRPVLSFLSKISTTQTNPDQGWLELSLLVGDQPQPLLSPGERWQASDWELTAFDLSAWRGQTVEVRFKVVRCSDEAFLVTLDRVSLGSAP